MKRRNLLAFACASMVASAALADDRTIRIIVGYSPGGSVDAVARLLAERLRVSLDQNVIVDNKPGAGGRLALVELKRSAPDGNTLVFTPSGVLVIHPWLYQNIGYDPLKDFTPLALTNKFDFAITSGPGAPSGDLKAVMEWMKSNPQKANYATSGAGTVPHFVGQLLAQTTGVPLTHVAYRGGAPAAQDLIAGQVPLMIDTASETLEHHRAGRVKILAMTGDRRNRAVPDIPTAKEAGFDFTADAFFGLYGPSGMQPARVQRISRAVEQAVSAPAFQDRIYALGLTPSYAGPTELTSLQAEQFRRWEAPIKSSGFKAE